MTFKRFFTLAGAVSLTALSMTVSAHAAPSRAQDDMARRDAADMAQFDHKAALSKELGATHILVAEGLPIATWELDKDDPYPAWFAHHASLLKLFPPKDVQPFMDMAYAAHIKAVVEKRCGVLRKYGLKAVWIANEPAVMPEAFFTAHPELRGPRIDQPSRSRKVYFAPNVDEPEMLRLYRESMQLLLKSCPEAETFNWTTTDAGSGFDWTPSLYPGINGNANYRDTLVSDRVSKFLINAQSAAKEAGYDIRINVRPIEPRQWMIPTFSPDVLQNLVRKLPAGLSVDGREGPNDTPFQTGATGPSGGNPFSPVIGIVAPSLSAQGPVKNPNRVLINLGDATSVDFNYRFMKATKDLPQGTLTQRMMALRAAAVAEVGEAQADNLVEVWNALDDIKRDLDVLDFGGMLKFGHVLNRWVTRPMVPYPEDLTAEEKKDYRAFIFQAKGEDQANNLADIQAMRMYEGYGAKLLFQRDIEVTLPRAQKALTLIGGIKTAAKDDTARAYWDLTGKRVQALIYLLQSADNMVAYQAQLDRTRAIGAKPETDPVLGVQSGWDRTDLMETARKEIDTMVNLKRLLDSTPEPILDLAPTAEDETIQRLGPNVSAQIKHKIDTMNAHWRDYDRLFTVPNP